MHTHQVIVLFHLALSLNFEIEIISVNVCLSSTRFHARFYAARCFSFRWYFSKFPVAWPVFWFVVPWAPIIVPGVGVLSFCSHAHASLNIVSLISLHSLCAAVPFLECCVFLGGYWNNNFHRKCFNYLLLFRFFLLFRLMTLILRRFDNDDMRISLIFLCFIQAIRTVNWLP